MVSFFMARHVTQIQKYFGGREEKYAVENLGHAYILNDVGS